MQIGNISNINLILNKLNMYNNDENLFLVSISHDISDVFTPNFMNQKITYHDNKGMDIGPFLLQMDWILSNVNINDYDYIFKIHSKTNEKWLINLLDINEDCLNSTLYSSINMLKNLDNYNREHILKICDEFNIPNIYYDTLTDIDYSVDNLNLIDISFYKSYYNLYINSIFDDNTNKLYILQHASLNNHALNESQIIVKNRHNVKFVAGTIFKIKLDVICEFFRNINIPKLYNLLENGYVLNNHSTYVHALERIISGFFY